MPSRPVEDHWQVLAEFRRALDPDEWRRRSPPEPATRAKLAMTAFLRGLEVRIANQFSIAPDASLGQFEIVPYSSRTPRKSRHRRRTRSRETDAELTGEALAVFQHRLHRHGARPAYQLGNNSYLVIDRGSQPVLTEIARVQRADREERKAFIRNPRAFLTERHRTALCADTAPSTGSTRPPGRDGGGGARARLHREPRILRARHRHHRLRTAPRPRSRPAARAGFRRSSPRPWRRQSRRCATPELRGPAGTRWSRPTPSRRPRPSVRIADEDVQVTPERLAAFGRAGGRATGGTRSRKTEPRGRRRGRPARSSSTRSTTTRICPGRRRPDTADARHPAAVPETIRHAPSAAPGGELRLGDPGLAQRLARHPQRRRAGPRQDAPDDRLPDLAQGST